MKLIISAFFVLMTMTSFAQSGSPSLEELKVFETCVDELDAEIRRVKKFIIEDFDLDIRQKVIFSYGPYQVSDQYFKIDFVIYGNQVGKIVGEFELAGGDEGQCSGVQFHDWVY